jgi:uncharacterized tellurite resistance protein B-like protein
MIGKVMLNRIKALFFEDGGPASQAGTLPRPDELQVAAAALLVEAAQMDERYEEEEREKIAALMTAHFGLGEEEVKSLLAEAQRRVDESHQLFGFTRIVMERFSYDERVQLMEMLWEVAYADGELHDYEASLNRRIAGLIHVPDRESGDARKRALGRLGLEP